MRCRDRLLLDERQIEAMATGLETIAELDDPVGQLETLRQRPSGIRVGRMRVPLGVIGIIYESRPNVTADAAGLCVKSGNAAILRGGSEAFHSNRQIAACFRSGLKTTEVPIDAVQLIQSTDRELVGELLRCELLDVVIPRGGKSLIQRVTSESRVPVIKHLDGICHVYIDHSADFEMAKAIALNAKTHRYGVCNAMETLLIHRQIAPAVAPHLIATMLDRGVEIRGCQATRRICDGLKVGAADESDWSTEYLAPILSIRVVDSLDDAIEHIAKFGSGHTDSIVTNDEAAAQQFLRNVDSSSVMWNASTRFADGFEYGLGGEIGISTNRLHVRGPVGLEGLTSQKWIVIGDGEIRG